MSTRPPLQPSFNAQPLTPPAGGETRYSRRQFLKSSLAAVGAAALWRPAILASPEPGKKLGVAVTGAGGMGDYSVGESLRENLVAIADVDENTIAGVLKNKVKDAAAPKIFHDYRKMLDECHRDIDVVLIAT